MIDKKKSLVKIIVAVVILITIFGLLSYFVGIKIFTSSPQAHKIKSNGQIQKNSEEITESLRNISETLSRIESILE